MGRTIHAHIEAKIDNDWHHYAAPSVTRDTVFFDLITNGNYGKEMPQDATVVTRRCCELDEKLYRLHDLRVVPASELAALQAALHAAYKEPGYAMGHDFEHSVFRTYVNGGTLSEHPGFDDLRIVCWFDN